jgi:hypothetical protein
VNDRLQAFDILSAPQDTYAGCSHEGGVMLTSGGKTARLGQGTLALVVQSEQQR